MASDDRVIELAKALGDVAKSIKSAHVIAQQLSDNNGVNDPNWNFDENSLQQNESHPNHDALDEKGFVTGTDYTPEMVSNGIGAVNNFIVYWDANKNNLEKLVGPIV